MPGRIALAFVALAALAAPASAFDVQTLKAPKGEQVWFVEDHTLPMIAMVAALPAGSAYDPRGKEGLATFDAAMLDEGAGALNSKAFHEALSNRAIRLSVSPDRDYTIISLVTLRENANEAFRLLGLALTKPRFDGDAIVRTRAQILTSLRGDQEDPATVAGNAFFNAFYAGHPYAHPSKGYAGTVVHIQRGDLISFARNHWVRGGMKIAVSGDVDAATLQSLLNSAFGNIPATTPPPIPPLRHTGAPGVHILPMPVPQPNIVFGEPAMARTDKDFLPAYVANYILGGGGFSSRLMNEVREKRGLTYGISTELAALQRGGVMVGQVATRADAVTQTIKVVRDTITAYVAGGPTPAELADAKTYLTGSFPLAFSSNAGIASQLSVFQRQGLGPDYVAKRNALINAVTVDDVKRASARVFIPSRLTIVIAGTPVKPKPTPLPAK
ncbi:MAG TPA: pitrilysin family protein [Rhizomicrobium sp.]|jgi:zinc protease|nr:pitrilysin family protein [Rhizomicrobium sp.]